MGKTYRTGEVVTRLGISRNTLYNWFAKGKIQEVPKDRNKRRIFTESDIEQIKTFKNMVIPPSSH